MSRVRPIAANNLPVEAAHTAPSAAVKRPCWLYVMNWSLRHTGGVNEVVRNLSDLTEVFLGRRAMVLERDWNHPGLSVGMEDGRKVAVASWPAPWSRRNGLRYLASFGLRRPAAVRRLRDLVLAEDVDTVHVHFPGLESAIWSFVRSALNGRLRLILSFHGLDLKAALRATGVERAMWRRLLRAADHIVVCAGGMRDALSDRFPEIAPRIRVIANGVDTARLQRAAAVPPNIDLPRRYLFSAATYEPKKGLDVLMRAFDAIADAHPDLVLLIAGRHEPGSLRALDALRTSLRSASRIRLLGDLPHAEAMAVIARATCFVLASREEPFGITVLEAGALAAPTIATSVCGCLSFFEPGSELLVVPPDNSGALASAIARLLEDPETAQRMARRMQAAVHARLEWSSVIGAYSELSGDSTH